MTVSSSFVNIHLSAAMSSSLDAPPGVTRPIVFFDITIGDTPAGRIKMGKLPGSSNTQANAAELFSDITPKYATSTGNSC